MTTYKKGTGERLEIGGNRGNLVGVGNRGPNREPVGILSFHQQMESPGKGNVDPGKSPYIRFVLDGNLPREKRQARYVHGRGYFRFGVNVMRCPQKVFVLINTRP